MNFKYLLVFGLLSTCGQSHAEQGCAPGFYPGGTVPNGAICVPIPGYGMSPSAPPTSSGPQWQLTWGAIAADTTTGDIGTSVDKLSKREAKREAIARCAAAGSRNCKLQLAYHNQCAAIAGPSEDGNIVGGTTIFQGGPTIELATQLALSACMAKRDGAACAVDYSECTTPVLVN